MSEGLGLRPRHVHPPDVAGSPLICKMARALTPARRLGNQRRRPPRMCFRSVRKGTNPRMPVRSELLSVVLPTRDRPERLREAAHSVLDQDYPHLELVVVDDGSDASTARVLDELVGNDPRVVVIRNDQSQGAAAARNAGLTMSQGELVSFCDDDDLWLPGAASAAVASLRPSVGLVYGWHEVLHESTGRRVVLRPPDSADPALMRWINVPAGPVAFIRRDRVGDALAFDTDLYLSEDWDLWLRCSDRAPIVSVPQALYRYVQHRQERVTKNLDGHEDAQWRFLNKHRSTMTAACVAHHELAIALANRDRQAGVEEIRHILGNPSRAGGVALLAGEMLASRVGQRRRDPGLPLRLASSILTPWQKRRRARVAVNSESRPEAAHSGAYPIIGHPNG